MQQPFDLSGKVALVTGAYRGLGFAIAQGLARAGAKVVLNGRRQDALDSAAEMLRGDGLEVSTSVFDVTDRAAIGAAWPRSNPGLVRATYWSITQASSA